MTIKLLISTSVPVPNEISQAELARLMRFLGRKLRTEAEWESTRLALGTGPANVNLHFCNDAEMRAMQKRFRKLDRTTDILSFPAHELSAKSHEREEAASLGDLVVSIPAVQRGAKLSRRPLRLELLEVLVHGVLHLIGCDHVRGGKQGKVDAERMRALQKKLFKSFLITAARLR